MTTPPPLSHHFQHESEVNTKIWLWKTSFLIMFNNLIQISPFISLSVCFCRSRQKQTESEMKGLIWIRLHVQLPTVYELATDWVHHTIVCISCISRISCISCIYNPCHQIYIYTVYIQSVSDSANIPGILPINTQAKPSGLAYDLRRNTINRWY